METIPVKVTSPLSTSHIQKDGQVQLKRFDQRRRMIRAGKMLGFCWLGALFAVPLPIVHFLLVPGLLLAGPLAAMFLYQRKEEITGGTALCPSCDAPLEIQRCAAKWPISETCSKCHAQASIMPAHDLLN
jgi:hypothetical protein